MPVCAGTGESCLVQRLDQGCLIEMGCDEAQPSRGRIKVSSMSPSWPVRVKAFVLRLRTCYNLHVHANGVAVVRLVQLLPYRSVRIVRFW